MRPKATNTDLLTTHNVMVYIHNWFVHWLKELKNDIIVSIRTDISQKSTHQWHQAALGKISTTANGWSANNTKASFLGITAHWIEVKNGKWKMCAEVVGFQAISGDHGGENLGWYLMGLCDWIGICNKNGLKVRSGVAFSNINQITHNNDSFRVLLWTIPQAMAQSVRLSRLSISGTNLRSGMLMKINTHKFLIFGGSVIIAQTFQVPCSCCESWGHSCDGPYH